MLFILEKETVLQADTVSKRMRVLALFLLLPTPPPPPPASKMKKKKKGRKKINKEKRKDEFLMSLSIAELYINRNMLTVGKQ